MTRPTRPAAMCCVAIGYQHYLMPADKGMKVVELLQHAVEADVGYERDKTYTLGEQPRVEFCMVKPSQIRTHEGALDAAPAPARTLRQPRLLK